MIGAQPILVETYSSLLFQFAKDKKRRRHTQRRKEVDLTMFIKPAVRGDETETKRPKNQVVPEQIKETKMRTKKHHYFNWGKAIQITEIMAIYINPAIYILFSVVYFIIGFLMSQK